jgi:predicted transcriptional regulator
MHTLNVTISDELKRRLDTLAAETGKSLDECLQLAVAEFVETWERHLEDVHQIEEGEARAVLGGFED